LWQKFEMPHQLLKYDNDDDNIQDERKFAFIIIQKDNNFCISLKELATSRSEGYKITIENWITKQ